MLNFYFNEFVNKLVCKNKKKHCKEQKNNCNTVKLI